MAWQASFLNKKTFRERLAFTTWQDTLSMKMKFLIFHFKETPFKRFFINVHVVVKWQSVQIKQGDVLQILISISILEKV